MTDLQDRIARLSPEKRALLQRLLRKEGLAVRPPEITPRPVATAEAPLSHSQRRLWFLDRIEPGNSFYNVCDSILLDEPVDPALVERSLNEIVRRHDVLRTTFVERSHEPVQVIAPSLALTLEVPNLTALRPAAREAAAAALGVAFAERPFDLSRGPLLRAALVRPGGGVSELLLSMHHIVSDAWSLDVLDRELRTLLAAFAGGQPSPLPPLPIQYADYAVWQRSWLTGDVVETQLAYWSKALAGAPRVLDLPIARPRPPVPSYRGAAQSRLVPAAVAQALRAVGQREGATLFMTTLAAFNVLLGRYTGLADIVVGTPVAGRTRAETEGLIGFFVNTLVVRTDLSGDPTFRTLLKRTREVCLGAFAHQDLPFEMLVEALQTDRDLSRNPLFQITFQCSTASDVGDDAGGQPDIHADAAPDVQPSTAKFDLVLNVWDGGGALRLQADYSSDLFDDGAIGRLLTHFERVLQAVAEQPDAPVSTVSLLSAEERHRALDEWNDTTSAYPRDATLDELFDRQVATRPTALAVTSGDERVTYAELDARADHVARRLRALGVGPESLVGLFMERSLDLIVGILGIVKAGGAYVPLDPEYPSARLAFMARDAGIAVLVTHSPLAGAWPDLGCAVVAVDAVAPDSSTGPPVMPRHADRPAYVIYTSGSTGTPKGVVVTHRNVVRTVCGSNYLQVDVHDRVAHASNIAFDAATFEIWAALLNGATLVVLPRDVLLEPDRLEAHLGRLDITILFVTTAVLNQVAARAPASFSSLRCLMFGGEAADAGAVRQILERGAPGRCLHAYGPTESTTFATWHPVTTVPDGATTIPIGRPVANTAIYILDDVLQPVPVGVVGELYIGGDGLARGYLNDPVRTAERFVPSPFDGPGERLYRSGDLARYLPDGAVEFVGRRDGQVKIRGHRIELGEVEAILREHPAVGDVVAFCRDDARGGRHLVACVAVPDESAASVADLRRHMAQRAPGYMTPSHFVLLPALPLTPNGKVDRAALAALEPAGAGPVAEGGRHRTVTEAAIARVFASVLHLDAAGADANFFELGGHSLLATQVVSRVREEFNVELPLRAIFTSPAVAALAAIVDGLRAQGTHTPGPMIVPVPREAYQARRLPTGELEIPEALKPLLHLSSS